MARFCVFACKVTPREKLLVVQQFKAKPLRICQNTISARDIAQITSLIFTFKNQCVELAPDVLKSHGGTCLFLHFSPIFSDVASSKSGAKPLADSQLQSTVRPDQLSAFEKLWPCSQQIKRIRIAYARLYPVFQGPRSDFDLHAPF